MSGEIDQNLNRSRVLYIADLTLTVCPPSLTSVMSRDLPLDRAGIISTVLEGVLYGM